MDTNALQQFKDVLAQNDRIGIIVGKNPTMDDMAAALSFYLSLKAANKQVVIASVTQPIVEFSSLVGVDQIKPSLGSATGDLVVSFPYQEGEIEKVSYTIEAGFLNIVVKAGQNGLNFVEQDVRFTRGGAGLPSLLVVIGTAQLASLGDLFNPETLKDTTIVNIDNKPDNQGFGDIVLVSTQYSSVSELVATMLTTNNFPMDVDIAQNLMNGISAATQNFQSPQTSYFAFEMVAELLRRGAMRLPVAQTPPQVPTFMQTPPPPPMPGMPRPQNMPRPQQQSGNRQQFGQQQPQRGQNQGGQRMNQQRMNQGGQNQGGQRGHNAGGQNQGGQSPQGGQNQQNRQDEIRRALAEQARVAREAQQQMQQGNQNPPMPQPQAQPQQPAPAPMPAPVEQPDIAQPQDAPSDWLTPKVYKGSSNVS